MKNENITRGDDLMLFDSQKKSLAFATSHTLTLSADVTEISCKDSGPWKDAIVNKLGWEISSENLYCENEYDKMFTSWKDRQPITVFFGKKTGGNTDGVDSPEASWSGDTSKLYTGLAIITNLTLNAASGDNATYSITLQGVGKFTKASEVVSLMSAAKVDNK